MARKSIVPRSRSGEIVAPAGAPETAARLSGSPLGSVSFLSGSRVTVSPGCAWNRSPFADGGRFPAS